MPPVTSVKNLMQAVEGSPGARAPMPSILVVHAYDDDTPIDETLRGLDDLGAHGQGALHRHQR